MRPKAFLLDLDGVITDTARYHFLAWKQLCEQRGFHFEPADNERLKGVSRRRSLEIILEINGCAHAYTEQELQAMESWKNAAYTRLIRQMTRADILPGIETFLEQAAAQGFRLAVASASRNAAEVLQRLELTGTFDFVANAALVKRTKPWPDVFLCCSEALGLRPDECVGVEDAQAGIEAIRAAGMLSVGIGVPDGPVRPDIPLASTRELTLPHVLAELARF